MTSVDVNDTSVQTTDKTSGPLLHLPPAPLSPEADSRSATMPKHPESMSGRIVNKII